MTSRAAPHHSEGSLSAARSGRSSFLDGMDCPHVKIARLELWAGVSSALGSRTSGCAQRLAYFVHCLIRWKSSQPGAPLNRGGRGQRFCKRVGSSAVLPPVRRFRSCCAWPRSNACAPRSSLTLPLAMHIFNVTNVWPPPSPPGLAELQQIVLNEFVGGRQWIGWCIASAVLLGSACFVAHGCWVQCVNTYVVLQARLSGRSGMAATEGPAVPPAQAMLRLRCHAVPSTHRAARFISYAPPACSAVLSLLTDSRAYEVSAPLDSGSSIDGTASTRTPAAPPPRLPRCRCRSRSLCPPRIHRRVPTGPSCWLLVGTKPPARPIFDRSVRVLAE